MQKSPSNWASLPIGEGDMKKMCVENLGFAGHSVSTKRKNFSENF